MIKRSLLLLLLFVSVLQISKAQEFFQTAALFSKPKSDKRAGSLNIIQDQRVDTLVSRYVLANKNLNGMWGFRIQIYRSGDRNAQEESNKVMADFMIEFPDIHSYAMFQKPNWFLVRAGDFRTKVEGTKLLFLIRRKFPHAYLVQDKINFPDLNNN
jgi:hypothetical protein